ncbi:MAG TPA: tripartite tricarboxylate transporter substrate binding protein [Burkholderiaceae bacterium]|nr:tripartite tricarboxylate transporter substrate binding protein [Burkholderiaceae bacterium]
MIRRRLLGAMGTALLTPLHALAQQPGTRAITIVIPFAPGGASDLVARPMADGMAAELSRAVIVENKGGAGGLLAAGTVGRAIADGQTLLYGNQGQMLVARHLLPGSGVNPLESLTPIVMTARTSFALVVPTESPFGSARELAAAPRAAPLRFGIPGVGSPPHLATALLAEALGTAPLIVPYQGSGQLLVDLTAGRLDAAFDNIASSLPHVRAGRLRALGLSAPRRSPAADDVPTLAEAGIGQFSYQAWQGLFAPVGTPREVTTMIATAAQRSLAAPSVRQRLEQSGLEVAPLGPEEFQALIGREAELWEGLVRKGALKAV